MAKLSVALISWNEEQTVDLCLKSLRGFADEVVLADTGSTDNTVKTAKRLLRELNLSGEVLNVTAHSLGEARKKAFEKTSNKWILLSDANMVYGSSLKRRFNTLMQRGRQGLMPSLNLIGDYRHYFALRKINAHHLTLFRRDDVQWGNTGDRPRLKGNRRSAARTPWAVNLSRVRPAWRCWYRGEPFFGKGTWRGEDNIQYYWLRDGGFTSIVNYIEAKQGLSLEDVKQIAPSWYLNMLQNHATPLTQEDMRLLPEAILEELKNPRYELVYEEGTIVGRKPNL